MKQLKFLHVNIARELPQNIKDCLEEQPARSGMYNWIFAFSELSKSGAIAPFWRVNTKEKLENYDIIQVNMSPKDMPIIPMIRNLLKNSSTKLVINNDYVSEYWGKWNVDPWHYNRIQAMGDMVFGTEPFQVSNMIKGAHCLPHPTNTKILKRFRTIEQRDSVGFIYHWWAGQTFLPSKVLESVSKKYDVKSAMYGYGFKNGDMHNWIKAMFDKVHDLMPFPKFADLVQGEKMLYDPNLFHTYGRNGVEMACFRKPVIGSKRVFSYNKLFPDLMVEPMDYNETKKKFDLVFKEKEAVENILDKAYDEVEYFNYKNAMERFMAAYDTSIDRGGYEWNQN